MSTVGASGTALITGITGQDGYYLSQLLQRNGFDVHGVPRDALTDVSALTALMTTVKPDVVFHLAAVSSVATSWQDPTTTSRVNALSTAALLDACIAAQDRTAKRIAMVNASSCEIFAGADTSPQTEETPLRPISPYGASKAFGHMMCQVYRDKGLEVSNAILYNHESPRRPERFVTRKITKAVAAIAAGRRDRLVLGDLGTVRDWGWAPDYVDAMYRMALHGKGDDYVVATGVAHSVRDFVAAAFAAAGIPDWQAHVETDAAFLRPREGAALVGDATRAGDVLGWHPSIGFDEIIKKMVSSDLRQEQADVERTSEGGSRGYSPQARGRS
jgi:GDPmannose 4,6-dehydratase